MNYLNEFDPHAAAWLRELRDNKLIPPCDIDTRSIEDVEPRELAGYTQCHFFAGIAGWPLALQLAEWPADRPIWTGSCPCQPFSAAGKGNGFNDERHLWPAFHWLIEQCRPAVVVGEQVASAAVGPWIDLVLSDLETLGYASGAYAGPSAGVGAPHIRDRSFWVGDSRGARSETRLSTSTRRNEGLAGVTQHTGGECSSTKLRSEVGGFDDVGLGDTDNRGFKVAGLPAQRVVGCDQPRAERYGKAAKFGTVAGSCGSGAKAFPTLPGSTNGMWRTADWLGCRDGKWRPVEPGTFPLAHGVPGRVGLLRGYGNAINPYQAAEFVKALMAYRPNP